MADNEFQIRITIDGQDARAEAKRIRKAIETELVDAISVSMDTSSIKGILKQMEKMDLSGAVEITGLEQSVRQMRALHEAGEGLQFRGYVEIQGLKEAREHMKGLRDDAGALGRAIGAGLGRQWDNIERHLTELQTRITGVVRAGEGDIVDQVLRDMPEVSQALSQENKNLRDAAIELRKEMQALDKATERQEKQFGRTFKSLADRIEVEIGELYEVLKQPYRRGVARDLGKELQKIDQEIEKISEKQAKAVEGRMQGTRQEIQRVRDELAKLREQEPEEATEEFREWRQQIAALQTELVELDARLGELRGQAMGGGSERVVELERQRMQRIEEFTQKYSYAWQEALTGVDKNLGSLDNRVEEVAKHLESLGRRSAAYALREAHKAAEAASKHETRVKRIMGRLQRGKQYELGAGAEGTMVDFIAAEHELGQVTDKTSRILDQQGKTLENLVGALDQAQLALRGMSEAEREAYKKVEVGARQEIRRGTGSLEERSERVQGVLARLAEEQRQISQVMEKELRKTEGVEAAEEEAQGILKIWQVLRDRLVGHSIIPDMVRDINKWLSRIGESTEETLEREIREFQEFRDAVAEQRPKVLAQIPKEQEKQVRTAQKLTEELGLSWETVRKRAEDTGHSMDDVVKALRRVKREQEKVDQTFTDSRAAVTARKLADELGISWETVKKEAADAGGSMDDVVRALRRVKREQEGVEKSAKSAEKQTVGWTRRFSENLSRVRMRAYGTTEVLRDMDRVARTMQFAGTAITGSLTLASRNYSELAEESDRASRSLDLNLELTRQMRQEIVGLSSDLAVLDPQETARGITIWAQATGQQVDSQEELNRLVTQTIPIQQLAALANENLDTVTDATAATLRQFGLSIDDTERVVAVFNKTADDTLAAVGDMAEAFKYVGPEAKSMGEELEDVSAIIGLAADQNIRGSQAGRAYRQMLISLQKPSKQTKDALAEVFGEGSPFFDQEGKFIGMVNVIDKLAGATERMTDEQRSAFLAQLFTANAIPMVTALVEGQIEARERNINAARAEAKILKGTIDEEVEAYQDFRKETENTTITLESATEVWDKALEDWEESDVRRLKQAEMRWKAFWLSVGESVVNFALPYLERGSEILKEVTSLVQASPQMGGAIGTLAAVGGGMVAVGTLLRAVSSTFRAIQGVRALAEAYRVTIEQQQAAATTFETKVMSAGERFRAIITGAAEEAAGIEVAGAQEETAIEKAGAQDEAAIEKTSAHSMAGIFGRVLLAYTAGDALSRAITGQGIPGMFTTAEGERAAEVRLAELEASSRDEMLQELEKVNENLELARSFEGKQLLTPGIMFGTAPGYGEFEELMGGRWRALSGTALADKIAELEALQAELAAAVGGSEGVMDPWIAKMRSATTATSDLADGIYDYAGTAQDAAQLTEEQSNAVDLYIEYLEKQEDAQDDLRDAIADANEDLQKDLADIGKRFDQLAEKEQAFYEEQGERAADYQRKQARQAEEHRIEMARMEEDHDQRMLELIQARDALGMVREQRRYEKERRRAEEDFRRRDGQRQEDFRREQAQREAQFQRRIEQERQALEEERQERLQAHQERVEELRAEHQENLARLKRQYFDKINAEMGYYQRSQTVQYQYQQAMLADLQVFLQRNRSLWQSHVSSLPTPQFSGSRSYASPFTGPYDTYQVGGYVSNTGLAMLHEDEFVLDRDTTRVAEQALGPLTQERLAQGLAGRRQGKTIRYVDQRHFEFSGSLTAQERARIREENLEATKEAIAYVMGIGE